jgi:succinate dehydrogenase / fumarate reductase flavoprotein subunit/L-aspartate oxidase
MTGYTPELRELIKKVEATRPQRVERARKGEHFPALTMDERKQRLNKYHPDFKSEGRSKVRVGPNKEGVFPDEVRMLLESRSRLEPSGIDLKKADYSTDVLVIGAGGAGTAAALTAEQAGCKVLVSTKRPTTTTSM